MLDQKNPDAKPKHYDVIIASDFRMYGGSTVSNAQEIRCQKDAGLLTAILPMYRYDFTHFDRPVLPEVWDEVDGKSVDILCYGQKVTCDLLIVRYPPVLYHRLRLMPEVQAKEIRVIINQPPMSDYSDKGIVRYELGKCADNIRHYFGKDAVWHPIGPLVRDALHEHHSDELHHITLSDRDWSNIIEIEGWSRGKRMPGPQDKLRIGRHSRDHEHKWPDTAEDILSAYPSSDDLEVHVLGGANTVKKHIGDIPKNWIVHPFGSIHPRDFLANIDVWIYFAHPTWVESFGRTIIEAMAVGVPVILPEVYRPLFADAALYATPETAVGVARALHADSAAYDRHVAHAQDYVQKKFSYAMHLGRIKVDADFDQPMKEVVALGGAQSKSKSFGL